MSLLEQTEPCEAEHRGHGPEGPGASPDFPHWKGNVAADIRPWDSGASPGGGIEQSSGAFDQWKEQILNTQVEKKKKTKSSKMDPSSFSVTHTWFGKLASTHMGGDRTEM